jgi:hypothetical protein
VVGQTVACQQDNARSEDDALGSAMSADPGFEGLALLWKESQWRGSSPHAEMLLPSRPIV